MDEWMDESILQILARIFLLYVKSYIRRSITKWYYTGILHTVLLLLVKA